MFDDIQYDDGQTQDDDLCHDGGYDDGETIVGVSNNGGLHDNG